jgi:hypothetical protein
MAESGNPKLSLPTHRLEGKTLQSELGALELTDCTGFYFVPKKYTSPRRTKGC